MPISRMCSTTLVTTLPSQRGPKYCWCWKKCWISNAKWRPLFFSTRLSNRRLTTLCRYQTPLWV
jgi:hypothetical protein